MALFWINDAWSSSNILGVRFDIGAFHLRFDGTAVQAQRRRAQRQETACLMPMAIIPFAHTPLKAFAKGEPNRLNQRRFLLGGRYRRHGPAYERRTNERSECRARVGHRGENPAAG
jgi:hypothetical protein